MRGLFEQTFQLSREQNSVNFRKILYPLSQQDKQRFESYMNKEELQQGIEAGEIFEGSFEGLGNSSVAYIATKNPKFKGLKIKVPNRSAQNRALHKDDVYFKILSEDEHIEVHDDPHHLFNTQDSSQIHHHPSAQAKVVYAEVLAVKNFYWKGKPIVGHIVKREKYYDYEPLNKKLPKFSIRENDSSFKEFLMGNGLRSNLSDIQTKYFSGIFISWNN